jgi:hypothetical protein
MRSGGGVTPHKVLRVIPTYDRVILTLNIEINQRNNLKITPVNYRGCGVMLRKGKLLLRGVCS